MKTKSKYSDDSDIILINKIKLTGCSKSMQELIDKHSYLFYDSVHRYHKNHKSTNLQDLLDDIYLVFNYSVKSFKEGKGAKFSTWLSHMTRFHCLNSNKKLGKTVSVENKDIDIIHQSQNKFFTFKDNLSEINDYLFDMLGQLEDKRIGTIYKLRYIEGGRKNKLMSWNEIGKRLGLSVSHVINLSEKGKEFLHNKLTSSNICDKV